MSLRRALLGPASLLLALLLAGCDDAFDPFVEVPQRFALYGFLDARQDTQFVRVQPVADRERAPRLGETALASTALGSGAVRAWQDSLVTLDDGSLGLLFFTAFRPERGEVYRIEVEGTAGAAEQVEVAMPGAAPLSPLPPTQVGGTISQRLRLLSDVLPRDVLVTYTVRVAASPEEVTVTPEVQPGLEGAGFDVFVRLSSDVPTVRAALGLTPDDERPIELLGLRLRYDLVDPTRAVVEGGLGAIGAAASFEDAWVLDTETVEALGYVDAQGGER